MMLHAYLMKVVKNDTLLHTSLRCWDLYTYPELPTTSDHVLTIKSASQLEKLWEKLLRVMWF